MFWVTVSVSVIVSLAVCALYVHFWRRRIRRDMETDAIIGRLRKEVGEIVTELNGTTERNVALIENRINALNELVDSSAKTVGVLRRESEKHDIAAQVYTSLERSRPVSAGLNLTVDDRESEDPPTAGKTSDDADGATVEAPVDEVMDYASLSPREKALVRHRNGVSIENIAAELEMSVGEVELIISLHERRGR